MYKYSGWIGVGSCQRAGLVEVIDTGVPTRQGLCVRKGSERIKKLGRSLKISCYPRAAYRSYPILSLQILTLILYLVYASHENDF